MANVNGRDTDGVTVLHRAANNGHRGGAASVGPVTGADKEAKGANGGTALHAAAVMGHVEAIKALVQLGAQIDAHAADGQLHLRSASRRVSIRRRRCCGSWNAPHAHG
jgi:ankyrin repeat protein